MFQSIIYSLVEKIIPPAKAEARWVGNTLTVAFHAATPPRLWQTSLDHGSTMDVVLEPLEAQWVIGIRGKANETQAIAAFANRDDAVQSFRVFQRALFSRPRGKNGRWSWVPPFFAGALVVWITLVAYMPLMRLSFRLGLVGVSSSTGLQAQGQKTAEQRQEAEAPSFPQGRPPSGVPVDADQALNPPPA